MIKSRLQLFSSRASGCLVPSAVQWGVAAQITSHAEAEYALSHKREGCLVACNVIRLWHVTPESNLLCCLKCDLLVQIRQALHRPVQRPARLLNNALEEGDSLNLNEAERAPALLAAPTMLPGEDRIRFWLKERSLLAVALHVKPGMTRAAEFLVPVQLCNRALSVPWPAGIRLLLCNIISSTIHDPVELRGLSICLFLFEFGTD